MTEAEVHAWVVRGVFAAAALTLLATLRITAPYGRHLRSGWGPTLPARAAWVVMEVPSVVWFLLVYAQGAHRADAAPLVLCAAWQVHYVQRTFVYPLLRTPAGGKPMPASIAAMGFGFNLLNAWLNARAISHLETYAPSWLADPRFLGGLALMAFGLAVNWHADHVLLRLKRTGTYQVPRGGLYRFVSCPNYLGEILEWIGFAIAAWSGAAAAFAVYTAANLGPRALANHRWYKERFPDYPSGRRALLPFVL